MTALQETTPHDLQARITGLLESLTSAMTGVGFLIGGVITSITTPPTAFAVSGIGVALLVLIAAVFRAVPDNPVPIPAEPRFESGARRRTRSPAKNRRCPSGDASRAPRPRRRPAAPSGAAAGGRR